MCILQLTGVITVSIIGKPKKETARLFCLSSSEFGKYYITH